MTRDDIIRMAWEAGFQVLLPQDHVDGTGGVYVVEDEIAGMLDRFAALVASEKEQQMIRDGWRQCAKGQRTTQYCGLLDAAVKAEREACAAIAEKELGNTAMLTSMPPKSSAAWNILFAIRARSET